MITSSQKQILNRVVIVLVPFLISLILAFVSLELQNWFGHNDLLLFVLYSIPFAVGFLFVSDLIWRFLEKGSFWILLPFSYIMGAFYGLLATWGLYTFLGIWFGSLSLPVLKIWLIAGGSSMVLVVIFRRALKHLHTFICALLILLVSFVLFVGFDPLISLATGNQHLTLCFYRYIPGSENFEVTNDLGFPPEGCLSSDDTDILKSTGLKGKIQFAGLAANNSTDWPVAKALIVFTGELDTDTFIRQPKAATIAYVQKENSFARYPDSTPTLDRKIEFTQDKTTREFSYWVEQTAGLRSGATLKIYE